MSKKAAEINVATCRVCKNQFRYERQLATVYDTFSLFGPRADEDGYLPAPTRCESCTKQAERKQRLLQLRQQATFKGLRFLYVLASAACVGLAYHLYESGHFTACIITAILGLWWLAFNYRTYGGFHD